MKRMQRKEEEQKNKTVKANLVLLYLNIAYTSLQILGKVL